MLTCEMKVNGILIGVLYIHNTDGKSTSTYEVVYHRIGDFGLPENSQFTHVRADGAEICVEKALKSLHGLKL